MLIASTVVPAMGVMPPPEKASTEQKVMQGVYHLLYGWTTALVFHLLSKD